MKDAKYMHSISSFTLHIAYEYTYTSIYSPTLYSIFSGEVSIGMGLESDPKTSTVPKWFYLF